MPILMRLTKFLNNMKPIIKTEKENKVALTFIERLMDGDPNPKTKEGRLLSLLSDAVVIFEKRYNQTHTCCDGECDHDDCCGKIPENCSLLTTKK